MIGGNGLVEYGVLKKVKTKLGNEIFLIGNNEINQNSDISLVIGVFHGDEPQGKFLIEEYLKNQSSPTSKSKISVLPPVEDTDFNNKRLIQLGKNLRNNSTKEEIILWQYLKQKQLGVKFRRQQVIGKYIVDFVCFEKRIIIELDGGQHNNEQNIEKDKTRDLFFECNNYNVIRLWNNEITQNIDGAIQKIQSVIECPPLVGGGFAHGRSKTSPDSEQIEYIVAKQHVRDSVSVEQIQDRPKSLISRWGEKEANLLFIPCLNPDGMQLGQRTNASGVDLNRNFPTKNWGKNCGDNATCDDAETAYYGGKSGGSEIETQFLIDTINEFKPNKILTLHAPYKVVNYDGPAKELAEKISKIINYPVEASIGYPTPGSFGTYAGVERQIPTITLELDEEIPVEQLIQPMFEIFDEVL